MLGGRRRFFCVLELEAVGGVAKVPKSAPGPSSLRLRGAIAGFQIADCKLRSGVGGTTAVQ